MGGVIRGALSGIEGPVGDIGMTFREIKPYIIQFMGDAHEIKKKVEELLSGVDPRKVVQQSKMSYDAGFSNEYAVFFVRSEIVEFVKNFPCNEKEVGFIANTLWRYGNANDSMLDWFLWVVFRIWNAVKAIFKVSDWQIARRMIASKLEDMMLKDANSAERKFTLDLKKMEAACEVAAEIFLMQALNVNRGSQMQFDHNLWLAPLQPSYQDLPAPEAAKAKASVALVGELGGEQTTHHDERDVAVGGDDFDDELPPLTVIGSTPHESEAVETEKEGNAVGAWLNKAGRDVTGFLARL